MTNSLPAMMIQDDAASRLRLHFCQRFGTEPRIFRAPGRVNLIGEHTDYNDGYVMPAAIEFSTWAAISLREDGELHLASLNLNETHTFDDSARPVPMGNWTDYVRGVEVMLRANGYRIPGTNILLYGNVPMGAGLSSSASLEIATAAALLGLAKVELKRGEVALLCQRAENEFVGARCGIMDQFIAANGRSGHALMLDCRSLAYELLPLPAETTIVVANSMVKHQLAASQYNARRAECEEGARILQQSLPGIRALRDVFVEQLEQHKSRLPPILYRRCRHVISENARVVEFARALRAGDLPRAGELMWASHISLRDDYEVSCRELDTLVALAEKAPGAVGSRMTGGGFGGCTVSLVKKENVEAFGDFVSRQYENMIGVRPDIYVTRAADGASECQGE